jgi:hypothetical protein
MAMTMKTALITLAAVVAFNMIGDAVAQYGQRVRPHWNALGSAVCPDNYDYYRGWCRERDYGGGPNDREDYGGPGGGVPPQWNSLGSAVCPSNYDYYAQYDRCLPR